MCNSERWNEGIDFFNLPLAFITNDSIRSNPVNYIYRSIFSPNPKKQHAWALCGFYIKVIFNCCLCYWTANHGVLWFVWSTYGIIQLKAPPFYLFVPFDSKFNCNSISIVFCVWGSLSIIRRLYYRLKWRNMVNIIHRDFSICNLKYNDWLAVTFFNSFKHFISPSVYYLLKNWLV